MRKRMAFEPQQVIGVCYKRIVANSIKHSCYQADPRQYLYPALEEITYAADLISKFNEVERTAEEHNDFIESASTSLAPDLFDRHSDSRFFQFPSDADMLSNGLLAYAHYVGGSPIHSENCYREFIKAAIARKPTKLDS